MKIYKNSYKLTKEQQEKVDKLMKKYKEKYKAFDGIMFKFDPETGEVSFYKE